MKWSKCDKYNSVKIHSQINEVMILSEVTQYFKNDSKSPIELSIGLPELTNCTITKFEMLLDQQKIVSIILEKEKAEEKYSDAIASGNTGFISYSNDNKTIVSLGNIPPQKEVELKSYYFGNLICNDLSYQATFPTIFPTFIIQPENNESSPVNYSYAKQIVTGKIDINCFSKLTRLIIKGSSNFDKIDKNYSKDFKSAEINIYKDSFSNEDIPGIILFRTESINNDNLFYQYDPKTDLSFYLFQKTELIPELDIKNDKKKIDENEELNYSSLIKNEIKIESGGCYIFLLDQSGSMDGKNIELCKNALILFLQSLNKGSYFQLIGFGSSFEYYNKEPLEYIKENVKKLMEIINNLSADKGGTELYDPLKNIFENPRYEKINISKHIFILTDGAIDDKETTLNLIGSFSDKFTIHSLGIGTYYDSDLIKRIAIMGNGNSFFSQNSEDISKNVIDALDQSQMKNKISANFKVNHNPYIEYNQKQIVGIYDFMRYGFILKNKTISNKIKISLNIEKRKENKDKEEIFNFDLQNIKQLPDENTLGKIIVNYFLKNNKTIDKKTEIKLSKDFSILSSNTAFFAEIQNEIPVQEDMVSLSNENKTAVNNDNAKKENLQIDTISSNLVLNEFNSDNLNDLNISHEKIKPKRGCFCNFLSNLFKKKKDNKKYSSLKINKVITKKIQINTINSTCSLSNTWGTGLKRRRRCLKNARPIRNIMEQKNEEEVVKSNKCSYNLSPNRSFKKNEKHNYEDFCYDAKKSEDIYSKDINENFNCKNNNENDLCIEINIKNNLISDSKNESIESDNVEKSYFKSCDKKEEINNYEKKIEKKSLDFYELIKSQDIFEGNWINNNEVEILKEEEKEIYEKIKKCSKEKNIDEENGIITLLVLYYIFSKKSEKVDELKFIINKAKLYIKKIYNLKNEEISKEFI